MYHQIARNKRKSVVVVAAFFIIWAAIGYVIGFIASGVSGGISGIIIAAILALLVVLWSLTLGQQTVLAVSGAQPVIQRLRHRHEPEEGGDHLHHRAARDHESRRARRRHRP